MSEKFVSKVVDENGDGPDVWWVVRVGSGGTSGLVTDDLETFRMDNFVSEEDEGECMWMSSAHRGLRRTDGFAVTKAYNRYRAICWE